MGERDRVRETERGANQREVIEEGDGGEETIDSRKKSRERKEKSGAN